MADQHLIPFLYEGEHLVRVIKGDDGEPWFVASDICRVLGLRNASKALQGLDDDEKGITNCYTLGGSQELLTVCEAGAYTLIIRSHKPIARPFRRWVTHDVLPSIRRTGGYRAGRRSKSALQEWTDQRNAACRMIDAARRTQGVRAAAGFAVKVFAELGYDISNSGPDQGELDLKIVGGIDVD